MKFDAFRIYALIVAATAHILSFIKLIFMKFFTVFFLALVLTSFSGLQAQKKTDAYEMQWKKIDELIKKGLPKSAMAGVNAIYFLAKKDNNDVQVVKALLYKITLQQNIEEDAYAKSIDSLEIETASAREPAKSILQSITAQMYWSYFQQNRYTLYQRTNTINFNKKDIATWTADDLHKRIAELYLASLKDEKLLQQTNLAPYEAIIIKGNVRNLRPTLYDLLAHRALDYFKNDERDISRPAYAFEIKDDNAFATANVFIQQKFITKDSASLHHKALVIFQHLLEFHLHDANPEALIDADIERISFADQYGVMGDKDSLYIDAMRNIATEYSNDAASAQASFLAAQKIYGLSSQKNSLSKYSVKQAKLLLDAVAQKFPESEGGINARNLINQITHPTLSLTTEKVNVPDLPFRTLVSYKNFNTVYFRLIQITEQLKKEITNNYNNDDVFKKLVAQQSSRKWAQQLPAMNDYLSHAAEVKIDALPVGEYALIGSADAGFSLNSNPLAAQYFYVSNISFINNKEQYFVLDRTSGQPLANAKIQVWRQQYDYTDRTNKLQKQQLLTADKNGYFMLPIARKNDNNYVKLEINYKTDKLFMDDAQYIYNNHDDETYDSDYINQKGFDKDNAKVFLFTDRSIYRPGQLLYFKGIGVTKDWKTKKNKLLQTKDSITVYLQDANGRNADSARFLLNEFGSFNGKFHLPENKLNGEFTINAVDYKNSSVAVSVEEYKRPKFYAALEKPKESFRINDTVNITGFAKAYAGNNIDGAKVSYHVTRVARFLYPWMFWKTRFPQTSSQEIAHGEIITNADGKFIINFTAIPDLSIDKNTDPVFDYKIEADVTDINGETRSANITVPVGYKSLDLQISLPQGDVVNIDSLTNIMVTSKNLSDEPITVRADIKIFKLQSPERLIRQRLWDEPDTFVYTKNEYIKFFPYDEYKDESKKEVWTKSEPVYSETDSTNNSKFKFKNIKIEQGWYVAEATANDKYGQQVKDVKYFQVYDEKSMALPSINYVWKYAKENNVEPGGTAQIIVGSSATNIFLIKEVDKEKPTKNRESTTDKQSSVLSYYTVNATKKTFDFKVAEDDRGGFGVNYFFVKDNRFYNASNIIYVPWSNKELNISFDTYRDKTLPGSNEKWKVKVRGSKGEKVAAEMLASMYDASLDQFKTHDWQGFDIWPGYSGANNWAADQDFTTTESFEKYWPENYIEEKAKNYDALNYLPQSNLRFTLRGNRSISYDATVPAALESTPQVATIGFTSPKVVKNKELIQSESPQVVKVTDSNNVDQSQIQIRKSFNETVFFYPELRTDKDGNIEFSFTMPEALTQWRLMTFAHTKDLASGYATKTTITQKDLMVQPNAPRFLREGDKIIFTAKVVNLTGKQVSGDARLQLFYASKNKPADDIFKNNLSSQPFTAEANQSAAVKFSIDVPSNFNDAVVYRIVAQAGNNSDGEEAAIPVVTNRMLVTETMPLPMRSNGSKDFKFGKLLNAASSNTLNSYALSVEYTTNPAWYAVQALPYLMEYPYECAEQTFNRYYANAIATKIVNSSPKIKEVFKKWSTADTAALLSNLQKNEELKSVLLEETPWVLQAQTEAQQKKNIALLFDMVRMSLQLETNLQKLSDMQSPNGGFMWFKGGPDDRYITQYILTGIGHLKALSASPSFQQYELSNIINKAMPYLDMLLRKEYDDLIKYKIKLNQNNLSNMAVQYLYMHSFFPEYAISKQAKIACEYFRDQSKKYWLSQNKYLQAMIALSLYRNHDTLTARAIIRSLKENSITNEELGMYWKEWNKSGYWWYQAPIESQAMMIEAFTEIDKDEKTIDDLKTWLLKNKQTNNWNTTKATADACYALLLRGTDWLAEDKNVTIKMGNTIINNNNQNQEAGSGYFKKRIDSNEIKPDMGNITVTVSSASNQASNQTNNQSASWGSVYWQYFENLDKITFSETPLKLTKKLFIEKNSDTGPVLVPVNDGDKIHVGDKIKVRIELRVDRDMEYVHMKDMRASCMEPTNVISQYKYQDGLGYYETTKDVSTNFFFDHLTKGTYVFEYPMFVTHGGNFSNGITTIQCMYAPEFTAHSEGVRVNVGN